MLVLKMEDYSRYTKDELVELISCLDSPVTHHCLFLKMKMNTLTCYQRQMLSMWLIKQLRREDYETISIFRR